MTVLLAGAVATRNQWNGKQAQQRDAVIALASDLNNVHALIGAARDSTDQHIALAQHLIGWMEQKEDASSTALVQALTALQRPTRAPASLPSVADLAATGQLGVVADGDVRTRVLLLDRRLAQAATAGEPIFERYRMELEASLSPGMWRYVFYGETGTFDVDYRAALRTLYERGFDRTLRSVLRGLRAQRHELDALATEAGALRAALQPATGHSRE
jgi:hypothetical protein